MLPRCVHGGDPAGQQLLKHILWRNHVQEAWIIRYHLQQLRPNVPFQKTLLLGRLRQHLRHPKLGVTNRRPHRLRVGKLHDHIALAEPGHSFDAWSVMLA
uniref:(northern house mosquito) hypothetical protein n=1 Tax=Culex pipiens TaxID=7175 RepID=A0A8D8GXX6_CULPI